jgi:predicted hydrocarbon binding protein
MATNKQKGDDAYKGMDKINAELFTLTYGGIVMQLIKDHETVDEVNTQLERMGYNIGVRLIEEFLAKSGVTCSQRGNIKETAQIVAQTGFKMFLGVTAQVQNWNTEGTEFSIVLDENPLTDFVELPEEYNKLWYSNLYCGVIRGALEMVQMKVECRQVKCTLRGDEYDEFRILYKGLVDDEMPVL